MSVQSCKRGAYKIFNPSSFKAPNLVALLCCSEGHSLHVAGSAGLADHQAPLLAGNRGEVFVENGLGDIVGPVKVFDHSPCNKSKTQHKQDFYACISGSALDKILLLGWLCHDSDKETVT